MKRVVKALLPAGVLNAYHYCLARMAAVWYRHPSEDLIVIGVTGTNGKSTTVQFIGRMLEHAGERVGWTTTASFKVADKEWANDQKMTMLGRFQTQRLLRQMVDAGCTYAVVETSSQGLAQHRHIGINYDVAAFTNLTPEHIEAHGGFENYKAAKGLLFDRLHQLPHKQIDDQEIAKSIVVNLQSEYAPFFASFKADWYGGCAWQNVPFERGSGLNRVPVIATDVQMEGGCTTFSWNGDSVHLKPIGRFYLENALLGMAVLDACRFDHQKIRDAVESLQSVPGRLERIDERQPFSVVVDYAYEPAALSAVYEAIGLMNYERLIHIVGSAGGGRDVARREILGAMSAEHDDIVIVTNEDPYDEDPMQIIDEVAQGAEKAGKQDQVDMFRILDRQEAVQFAIDVARPGDLVLITGKGSEPVMAVAHGKKIPWDDRVAARVALQNRYAHS